MSLKLTLQNDMKAAMKAHDPLKVGALRMVIAEIKKKEIDKRAELDEAEVLKTISALMKQRNDSIEAFLKGGRQDLVDKEKLELEILKAYLPTQLGNAEVEKLVVEAIQQTGASKPEDIGKVMKAVLAKAGGRADGKLVNEIARAKLASAS